MSGKGKASRIQSRRGETPKPKAKKTHPKHEGTLPNVSRASFSSYIKKLLLKIHSDVKLSKEALNTLDYHIYFVIEKVAERCNGLVLYAGGKTVSSRMIQTCVRMILPGELSKHAVITATKAITADNAIVGGPPSQGSNPSTIAGKVGKNGKVIKPAQSTENRTTKEKTGLTLSNKKVEKILRRYIIAKRVSKGAGLYLTAVLEYLISEVLELTGNVSRDLKKSKITMRHLFLAVSGDEELSELFNKFNLFYQSGVVPHIARGLLKKTKGVSKANIQAEE